MKKTLILVSSTILFLALSTQIVEAGPLCIGLGGTCKTNCGSDETDEGLQDCSQSGIIGGSKCCVPKETQPPSSTCPGTCRVGGSCLGGEHSVGQKGCTGFRAVCCVSDTTPPDEDSPPDEQEESGPIKTAIGEIDPRNLQGFIQQLLNLALGMAGGIAFLLMLFGAFQIMTSSGDPEKMKAGSELITSALTGLLFIVFSIFLLRLIGVDILQIPGFGLP